MTPKPSMFWWAAMTVGVLALVVSTCMPAGDDRMFLAYVAFCSILAALIETTVRRGG